MEPAQLFFVCLFCLCFFFFSFILERFVFGSAVINVACARGSELSLILPNLPFTHILPSILLSSVSRGGLVPAVPHSSSGNPKAVVRSPLLGSTHATQPFSLLLFQSEPPLRAPLKFITSTVYFCHSKVDAFLLLFLVQVRWHNLLIQDCIFNPYRVCFSSLTHLSPTFQKLN